MRRACTPDHFFTIQLSEVIDLKELSVIVSHNLGSDRAKRKLVQKIEELQKEFKGKFTLDSLWEDNSPEVPAESGRTEDRRLLEDLRQ